MYNILLIICLLYLFHRFILRIFLREFLHKYIHNQKQKFYTKNPQIKKLSCSDNGMDPKQNYLMRRHKAYKIQSITEKPQS